MKIGTKKIICMILCLAMLIFIAPKAKAAGLVIAFSDSTVDVGDTVTVTVTGNGVSGTVNLSVSGDATLSQNSVSVNNGSASVTATINGEGSIRITATAANMTDTATSEAYTGATGGTITAVGSERQTENANTDSKQASNANLTNLGIRPNDFTGFSPNKLTYDVTVPEDVESVEVYATAQATGATISGTGMKTLEYGENALDVVVTAQDGTVKTYTINVTREGSDGAEEAPAQNTETQKGLSSIKIGDLTLNPSFATNVYEYTVKYIGKDTSLNIETVPTDPNYVVEILGNEELKEGENTITILVSDSEGNNVATYQLTVNKSLVDEEALAKEKEEKEQAEQRKMMMIAGGIIALILIIVIVIVIRRKRNRAYAEEFSGIPFAGMNDEDYNDEYDSNEYDDYNNQEKVKNDDYSLTEENDKDDTMTEEDGYATEKIQEDDNHEEIDEKERAKREFLNGYNSDNESYFEEEKTKRRRKGIRFK